MEHYVFIKKQSFSLGNKYPSDPCKNWDTRPAYGNYFPLDRDLQKRRLEILPCLLVAALLSFSSSQYNKTAALNSHSTAIINAHLCLYATTEAEIHISPVN